MSFQYELTLFCYGCGDFFEPTGVMRRRDLPSEKAIVKAQTDWKFVKDKQLGYKAYCPKCQETRKMKKEKEK